MAQELEKARVTEIKVRMDCNGCVHKIKKALHNIDGIYDVFTDYPQQKVTVVGRADPEKILKAIKKTRKVATICSHVEPVDQPPNPTPETEEQPAAPDTTNNPPSEPPPAEAAPAEPIPAAEPAKEEPPPQQSTAPEASPPPAAGEAPATSHPVTQSEVKDVGEIHMVHHYPDRHGYGYSDHWNSYPGGQVLQDETHQVIHSYNSYRPSPYVSGFEFTGQTQLGQHSKRVSH
ncbi:hypothetical protein QJS04_geneDACA007166 [Acorus gramineus]|uniref:HMA domain-containing protein n=1 Tax=Acorus gramineus TaxID=55184 RepID=A0AAV9BRV8_ACOGR|nr:hypothetical protein QJS04_geneDACA007166 [Acorus gramineus]